MLNISQVADFVTGYFRVEQVEGHEDFAFFKGQEAIAEVTVTRCGNGWEVYTEGPTGESWGHWVWATVGDIASTLLENRASAYEDAFYRWQECPWQGKPKSYIYMVPEYKLDKMQYVD